MSQIPSVRSIREALLEQTRQSVPDEVAIVTVRHDLEACARVARRAIERAIDFASRGLLGEALSVVEDFPDLVRQAEALRTLLEDAGAGGGMVREEIRALVDRGVLPTKAEVDALVAIVMRAEAQRPLVDALRMSALRGEPLDVRLGILRRIRASDSRNRMWLDQIEALETAWLRQIEELCAAPSASYELLEDAVTALTSHEWVVSVPRGLQEALLARLAPMRAERADARYHELMREIHDAAARMDRDEITRLEADWARVSIATGRMPDPAQAASVAPAFTWLTSLEQEEQSRQAFENEVERLEVILNEARPVSEIERQVAVLRDFGREAPEGLLDRAFGVAEAERSRQRRQHRLYLVSAACVAVALVIVGGFLVGANAESRARARELAALTAAIDTASVDNVRTLSQAIRARGVALDAAMDAALARGDALVQGHAIRQQEVKRALIAIDAELERAPARQRLTAIRATLTALRPDAANEDRVAIEKLDTLCLERITGLDQSADRASRDAVAAADAALARWKLPDAWSDALQIDPPEWARYIGELDGALAALARARDATAEFPAGLSRIELKREIIDARKTEANARSEALAAALRDLDPLRLCAPITVETDFIARLAEAIQRHGAILARQGQLAGFEAASDCVEVWRAVQAWREDFRPGIVALLGSNLDRRPSEDDKPRVLELMDGYLAAHPATPLRRVLGDLSAQFDPARQSSRWSIARITQALEDARLDGLEEVPLEGGRRLYVRGGKDPDPRSRAIENISELAIPAEKLNMILSVKQQELIGPPVVNEISVAWTKATEQIRAGRTTDLEAELLNLAQAIAASRADPLLCVRALLDTIVLLEQSGHMPSSAAKPLADWREFLRGSASAALAADWVRAGYEPEANSRTARREATAALARFPNLATVLASAQAEQAALAGVLQPLVPVGILAPADGAGRRLIWGQKSLPRVVAARRIGKEWELIELITKDGVVEQADGLPKGPILIFRRQIS
jgi:hypothetical protein